MPPSPRSVLRRLARSFARALAATAAIAACAGPSDPIVDGGGPQPRFDLTVRVLDAGDTVPAFIFAPYVANPPVRLAPAGGLVVATGHLWPGETNGRVRRVTDGRLVVNGAALDATVPPGQRSLVYGGELGTPRADGVVTLALPRIDGIAPVTLRMQGLARDGATAVLTGDELRLRVAPPPSPVQAPYHGAQWAVALVRGERATRVEASTPLPREVVLPVGSLVPGTGPITAALSHTTAASATLQRPTPTDTTYLYQVMLTSSLRFAPVAP
ncbi:MAG: hypothetical protein ACXW05_11155 [Gemmatirosa sp.]